MDTDLLLLNFSGSRAELEVSGKWTVDSVSISTALDLIITLKFKIS